MACSVREPYTTPESLRPVDRWTPWVVAALAVVFFATVCRPILPYGRQHDFLSFYTGAALIADGRASELYDLPCQTARERSLVPGLSAMAPYIRPPFYAVLLTPLARLPLEVAFGVWLSAQIAVLLGVWAWAYRRHGPDSLVFCSLFLPAAYGIAHGQDCVFLLAALLSAATALERRHDGRAGCIAALLLVKIHLVLLLAPVMLLCRKWRMFAGFAAVALIEAGASLAIIRPAGVRQYIALLTADGLETLSPSPERMINVQALLLNSGIPFTWLLVPVVAVVTGFAAWRARHSIRWFWIGILGSILIAPHAYQYDAALLFPPMLACLFERHIWSKLQRMLAAAAALPVVYLGTLIGPPWSGAPALVLTAWFAAIGLKL